MDVDELDRWLDADDGDGDPPAGDRPAGARPAGDRLWPDAPDPIAAGAGRRARPRWLVPLVVAGAVWLAVAAVLLLEGGEEPQDSSARTPAASPDEVFDPDPATGSVVDLVPDGAAADDATGLPSPEVTDGIGGLPQPGATAAASPSADAGATGGGRPAAADGVLRGAAVAGLRVALTGSAAGRQRYLELATPVAVHPLPDGVALVLVDAVWLEGEGALSEAHQGRWAVPVADDGTVLQPPWPVPGAPPPLPAGDPPLGTMRLTEVAPAMAAAGWTDVVAMAADPHPFLEGVVVALVSGTAPGGAVRDGDVVWLQAQEDGLVLLGAVS